MAKNIIFEQDARDRVRNGVKKLANAVKITLGPRGRNVLIEKPFGAPSVTKDGVTVARNVELNDPWENMGAQLVKEVASKTADLAGDGTTTATVLAEAILDEGLKNIVAGANPVGVRDGIDMAVTHIVAGLEGKAKKVSTDLEIEQVGRIAANNDLEIGKLFAQALSKVGKHGVITVEESKGLNTEIEFVDGMQFDKGYVSPYFVSNQQNLSCELEDAMILLFDSRITTLTAIMPFLEKIAKSRSPLLIIADDISEEPLTALVVNKLKGVLNICVVRAPSFGDRRKAMLEDIAILTGGKLISAEAGMKLEEVTMAMLGKAERVIITKDTTTIIEGGGTDADVKSRIDMIEKEITTAFSDFDKEKLRERLAKLSGGVAKLKVGAATETAMKEKKDRVEDALHATRAATESGILPGGGVALLRLAETLSSLSGSADEKVGIDIVRRALSSPLKQIATNAGLDGSVIAMKTLENSNFNFGLNVATNVYEDLVTAGVVDPTKVTVTALRNAASVATLLLTTNCCISAIKNDKEISESDMPPLMG